jgi:hypothetical protein
VGIGIGGIMVIGVMGIGSMGIVVGIIIASIRGVRRTRMM